MLPKIHKVNNPGRPVISSVNNHTEKISAYVDEFLRPIAERLPSYTRDTTEQTLFNEWKSWENYPQNVI